MKGASKKDHTHGNTPADHVLAMNTAEGLLQFVIARLDQGGAQLLSAQSWHAPSQGAELLAPALADTLARLTLAPAALTRIAVVRGPGSFTGLRLSLVSASGLCRATGALCAGIDYLPLLAQSAAERLFPLFSTLSPGPLHIWTITHARRGLVHAQGFCAAQGAERPQLSAISDILVLSPAQTAAAIAERSNQHTTSALLGSGLANNRDAFTEALAATPPHSRPCLLLPDSFNHPAHKSLLETALAAPYARQDIAPLYVRPSDAEENLAGIAQSLHLDPAEAIERMHELTSTMPGAQ